MVPLDDCREPVFNTPEHQNLYAEVMALPATVRTRLARAREKLKAQLREE